MGNQHMHPIHNPPVPYRGALPMAPGHGATVIINGVIPSWCNRFQINLETEGGDKALHFNPRFEGTNQVIRNSCRNGAWGNEERGGYFPFQLGQPFELAIVIEQHHYKISVNHAQFCEFHHRIPKDQIRVLGISGDIQLHQIHFKGGACAPICNPPVPFNTHIQGGLYHGKMIRINGTVGYNPSRFNVNFVAGNGSNGDMGMHCDVRFNYGDSHNIVVRTHRQNGGWGAEERHAPFFPFRAGTPFEMIVKVDHDKYMIAVNGQHMFEFRHRMHPIQRFDHLRIDGDVSLQQIQFH